MGIILLPKTVYYLIRLLLLDFNLILFILYIYIPFGIDGCLYYI